MDPATVTLLYAAALVAFTGVLGVGGLVGAWFDRRGRAAENRRHEKWATDEARRQEHWAAARDALNLLIDPSPDRQRLGIAQLNALCSAVKGDEALTEFVAASLAVHLEPARLQVELHSGHEPSAIQVAGTRLPIVTLQLHSEETA
ncbi:MAG: hypothetical protein QM711_03910 [Micropruina sp.]|uniref:hypothetical protein n=1 Tax=Micropruina sp. TaxID=2737536 RepID=UPI0039E420F2